MGRKIDMPIVAICENNSDQVNRLFESVMNKCGIKIKPYYVVLDNSAPNSPFKVRKKLKRALKPLVVLDNTQSMLINYMELMTSSLIKIPEQAFRRDYTIQWLIDNLNSLTGELKAHEFIIMDPCTELKNPIDFVDKERGYPIMSDVSQDHGTGRSTLLGLIQYYSASTFRAHKIRYFNYDPDNPIFTESYQAGDYAVKSIVDEDVPFRRIDSSYYVYLPDGLQAVRELAAPVQPAANACSPVRTEPQAGPAAGVTEDAASQRRETKAAEDTQPSDAPGTAPESAGTQPGGAEAAAQQPPLEQQQDPTPEATVSDGADSTAGATGSEAPVQDDVKAPVEAPVSDNVETPVSNKVEAPVSDNVETPASDNIESPVSDNIESPVSDNIETPGTEPAIETAGPADTDGGTGPRGSEAPLMGPGEHAPAEDGGGEATAREGRDAETTADDEDTMIPGNAAEMPSKAPEEPAGTDMAAEGEKPAVGDSRATEDKTTETGDKTPAADPSTEHAEEPLKEPEKDTGKQEIDYTTALVASPISPDVQTRTDQEDEETEELETENQPKDQQPKDQPEAAAKAPLQLPDVLYVLGRGSIWHNNEIKYSLRSLYKNGINYGRIFIASEKLPDFIDSRKVIHVRVSDDPAKNGWYNVFRKVTHVLRNTDISDRFVFMMDDVFITKPSDFTCYPVFIKGMLKTDYGTPRKWHASKARTCRLLMDLGLGTGDFELHSPIVYEKERYLKMAGELDRYSKDAIFPQPRSYYCNRFVVESQQAEDLKLKRRHLPNGRASVRQAIGNLPFFSVSDEGLVLGAAKYLKEWLPEKSYWEVGSAAGRPSFRGWAAA